MPRGSANAILNFNARATGFSAITSGLGGITAGAATAAAAVAAIGVAATVSAAKLDQSLREVDTLLGLSADGFDELTQNVLDFSDATGVATDEVVPALYNAISAGVPQENVFEFLEQASALAIGGVTTLQASTDLLTTSINAYASEGLSAARASDVWFSAVRAGKTTIDEIAASAFNLVPVAAQFGLSIEEAAAAMATLTLQGVPTSVAMTQVRQLILALAAPTVRTAGHFRDLGIEVNAARLANEGLEPILREIIERTGGNEEQIRRLLGSQEALNAAVIIAGEDFERYRNTLDDVTDSQGATADAADRVRESVGFQFQQSLNQLRNILDRIGLEILPIVNVGLQAFSDWWDDNGDDIAGYIEDFGERIEVYLVNLQELEKDTLIALRNVTVAIINSGPDVIAAVLAIGYAIRRELPIILLEAGYNAIRALAQSFEEGARQLPLFREILTFYGHFTGGRDAFGDLDTFISNSLREARAQAADARTAIYDNVRRELDPVFSNLADSASSAFDDLIADATARSEATARRLIAQENIEGGQAVSNLFALAASGNVQVGQRTPTTRTSSGGGGGGDDGDDVISATLSMINASIDRANDDRIRLLERDLLPELRAVFATQREIAAIEQMLLDGVNEQGETLTEQEITQLNILLEQKKANLLTESEIFHAREQELRERREEQERAEREREALALQRKQEERARRFEDATQEAARDQVAAIQRRIERREETLRAQGRSDEDIIAITQLMFDNLTRFVRGGGLLDEEGNELFSAAQVDAFRRGQFPDPQGRLGITTFGPGGEFMLSPFGGTPVPMGDSPTTPSEDGVSANVRPVGAPASGLTVLILDGGADAFEAATGITVEELRERGRTVDQHDDVLRDLIATASRISA